MRSYSTMTYPSQPRAVSSSEDEDELEAVYPGPICISCSGIDNDPLIWCSGCAEPYHYECAKGYPKEKYGQTYRWLCLDCRQSCVSCSYPVLTISTFNCKTCWKIIHRRCIDPQVRILEINKDQREISAAERVPSKRLDMLRMP